MPIQYTPIFQLPYPQVGDPVKEGQANIEGIAKKVETALVNGSFPSSNPDVASITARLNNLEKPKQRMEFKTATPFAVAASQNWDIGPLQKDSTNNRTVGTEFANSTGALSGAINITQSGFYIISAFVVPTGGPGNTWISINTGTLGKIAQGGNNAAMWEAMAHVAVPTYIAAGDYVRVSYTATTAHSINSRLMIHKAW